VCLNLVSGPIRPQAQVSFISSNAVVVRSQLHQIPVAGIPWKLETLRSHADDLAWNWIEPHGFPDDVWIGPEQVAPGRVRNDDHTWFLAAFKSAAKRHARSEHFEKPVGHAVARGQTRAAVSPDNLGFLIPGNCRGLYSGMVVIVIERPGFAGCDL